MQRTEVRMNCPAPDRSPDQAQVANPATTLCGLVNGFGFNVLVILVGIARALM
jgi:hypothetical protein